MNSLKYERINKIDKKVDSLKLITTKEIDNTWVHKYEDGSYLLDCQTESSKNIYYVYVSPNGKIEGNGAKTYKDDIVETIKEFENKMK